MNCCNEFGQCTQGKDCAARCTQDCNQGRNCTCKPTTAGMTDGQMGWLYFFMLMLALLIVVLFKHYTAKPTSAIDYANKYCQELYGPQTGAHWADDQMACITVRGEIVPAKQP
jgi:hypothetical protein